MKFILTKELGRLTRWLRLLGFDSVYFNSDDMKKLFVWAFNEERIIVTKRKSITSSNSVQIIYIKSDLLKDQFRELQKKLNKEISNRNLFTRCADCNRKVFSIDKSSVMGLVPEYVFKTQKEFFQCPGCEKIFWKATHWGRAQEFVQDLKATTD